MWGSETLMWGFEPLVWGTEVNFTNNVVWRSEVWGSWPPNPPTTSPFIFFFSFPSDCIIIHPFFTSSFTSAHSSPFYLLISTLPFPLTYIFNITLSFFFSILHLHILNV